MSWREEWDKARDIGLLEWDTLRARYVIRYEPDAKTVDADPSPDAVFSRMEPELAGEAKRYRQVLWLALLMLLSPGILAMLAWAAMDVVNPVLHIPIVWLPFERGGMGLPGLSLYEWTSFLVLAAFLVYGAKEVLASHGATKRLSADYRRLAAASDDDRCAYAIAVVAGSYPRCEMVLSKSPAFEMYHALIAAEKGERPPAPPAGPVTAVHWTVGQALGVVVVVVGFTLLGGVGVRATRAAHLGALLTTLGLAASLLGIYAAQWATVWGMARAAGVRLADAVGLRRFELRWIGAAVGWALVARVLAGLWAAVVQRAGASAPGPGIDVSKIMPAGTLGVVFIALLTVVAAPVIEEMIFRGVVFSAFSERFGSGWGALVSAAVFASLHPDLYAAVPIFVLALVLAELFRRSRSLWVPIAAHLVFNGVGLLGVYLLKVAGS